MRGAGGGGRGEAHRTGSSSPQMIWSWGVRQEARGWERSMGSVGERRRGSLSFPLALPSSSSPLCLDPIPTSAATLGRGVPCPLLQAPAASSGPAGLARAASCRWTSRSSPLLSQPPSRFTWEIVRLVTVVPSFQRGRAQRGDLAFPKCLPSRRTSC